MKNLLFNLKAVQTGSYKAEVGARAETFWKPEPKLERNKKFQIHNSGYK